MREPLPPKDHRYPNRKNFGTASISGPLFGQLALDMSIDSLGQRENLSLRSFGQAGVTCFPLET